MTWCLLKISFTSVIVISTANTGIYESIPFLKKIKYQAAEGNIFFKKDREINGDSVINFRICSWRRDKTVLVREVKN